MLHPVEPVDPQVAWRVSRRSVVKASAATAAVQAVGLALSAPSAALLTDQPAAPRSAPKGSSLTDDPAPATVPTRLVVNGREHMLALDPRTSVLDALRENLGLKGTKKGCDHGQCGACTILVEGRRINACLTLAVMHDGQAITTIEGLSAGETLHPMQAAFLKHDGFQCGYCTPGQICSSVGMLAEARNGMPSHVTRDLEAGATPLTDEEIRERMSGNLCRCSAYPNIVAAIRDVAGARA